MPTDRPAPSAVRERVTVRGQGAAKVVVNARESDWVCGACESKWVGFHVYDVMFPGRTLYVIHRRITAPNDTTSTYRLGGL